MSALTDALNEYFPTIMPAFKTLMTFALIFCIFLYIIQIAWVVRDAMLRTKTRWWVWAIVSIIPLFGLLIYLVLRPSMFETDRKEQELGLEVHARELGNYGNCQFCGGPVEKDFVVCPWCQRPIKNRCHTCGHALVFEWRVCPYCGTRPSAQRPAAVQGRQRGASNHAQLTAQQQQQLAAQQQHQHAVQQQQHAHQQQQHSNQQRPTSYNFDSQNR